MTPEDYTKTIDKNSNLDNTARPVEAAKDLGVANLSLDQVDALNKAHNTGTSGA